MSDRIKTEYIKTNKQDHFLKCELYYSLGGYNCFTYRQEGRGYYISVTPVERREYSPGFMMEGVTAFSGYKMLVEPVQRKGKAAEHRAAEQYERVKQAIIDAHFKNLLAEPEAASA